MWRDLTERIKSVFLSPVKNIVDGVEKKFKGCPFRCASNFFLSSKKKKKEFATAAWSLKATSITDAIFHIGKFSRFCLQDFVAFKYSLFFRPRILTKGNFESLYKSQCISIGGAGNLCQIRKPPSPPLFFFLSNIADI